MIKRYILHIETHWRHLPRISFKRAPRPGDHVKDGGVWGTLRRCPTCQEGFLHEPDPPKKRKTRPAPPGPHKWLGGYCVDCENNARWCPYPPAAPKPPLLGVIAAELAKSAAVGRSHRVRSDHTPRRAMDFNAPTHVDLKIDEPEQEKPIVELKIVEPAEHVELKLDEPAEHVELKLEDESPEELELDYKRGKTKHKRGDILWTHKAEYVVDKLEKDVLYLVRKDVWDEREKKATHVELKADEPAEHVELKVEDEKPTEIVRLTFD